MKKFLLPSVLFFATAVHAQITVTSSDMPNAGDSVQISVAGGGIGSTDPTLTGAGYTWDYSTLVPTIQRFDKYDSPTTFTSPFNIIFNPINTSFGRNNYQLTTLPIPGVTLNSAYDFLKKSTSSYKQIGAGYVINSAPLPFYYTSSDVIYRFPMDYLNTDSSDYKFGLPIPTIGYYGETGHRVNVVDGWGSVTTPYGTFSALRVNSAISSTDTLYVTSFSFGTLIPRPLRREFKWLANGMKIPVLEIDANDIAGNLTVTNVQYIDSARAGVPSVGIAENSMDNTNLAVFPNPATDNVIIQYNIVSSAHVQVSVTDVVGKTIAVITDQVQPAGIQQRYINAADLGLSPGIYFVNLQIGNFRKVQKVVVTR